MFDNVYSFLSFILYVLLCCTASGLVLYCIVIQLLAARVSLLARLMGQYCFARWRMSSVVVLCNTACRLVGGPAAGRAGGRAADTPHRASSVASR